MAPSNRLVVSGNGITFMNMAQAGSKFRLAIPKVVDAAAAEATSVSRATFSSQLNRKGRPQAPVRLGRPTTLGEFANSIVWERLNANARGDLVGIDMRRLPIYALIQEIGTGYRATITNPPGEVTVRGQYGRQISANLFWSSGVGGSPSGASTGGSNEQLFYQSDLNAKGKFVRRKKRIRIEIKGKHYLQDGGRAGFLELKSGLTDEAKRIFK